MRKHLKRLFVLILIITIILPGNVIILLAKDNNSDPIIVSVDELYDHFDELEGKWIRTVFQISSYDKNSMFYDIPGQGFFGDFINFELGNYRKTKGKYHDNQTVEVVAQVDDTFWGSVYLVDTTVRSTDYKARTIRREIDELTKEYSLKERIANREIELPSDNDVYKSIPESLSISNPEYENVSIISSGVNNDGVAIEVYEYQDVYNIELLVLRREYCNQRPYIGELQLSDFIELVGNEIQVDSQIDYEDDDGTLYEEIRFKGLIDDKEISGAAKCTWTKHYVVILLISTTENENKKARQENEYIFTKWFESLVVQETTAKVSSTIGITDEKINAGEMTPAQVHVIKRIFKQLKFNGNTGHGFAAEQANNLADNIRGLITGKHSKVTGDNFIKNGEDRVVTDYIHNQKYRIQSKYYKTGKECINACFSDDGSFKYYDSTNKPMIIEVPKDEYAEAVKQMEKCITEGKIQNVSDPAEAKNIVKQGNVTYKQACNIAKAGNIDSLWYDSKNASVESAYSFGISAVVEFAISTWNGEDFDTALSNSVSTGLSVAGTSFVISVLATQLSRTALNSALVGSSDAIAGIMGYKAASVFSSAFHPGGNLYGAAAMKSASKLIRSSMITSSVTMVVLTVPDVIDTFRGRISGRQLLKNTVETTGGVVGGAAGWFGGALAGGAIGGPIGAVIGGVTAAVGGGYAGGMAGEAIADLFGEDDADLMLDIISDEFETLGEDYLLNQEEAEWVSDDLNTFLDGDLVKEMFSSEDQKKFAADIILRPSIEEIVGKRETIEIPSDEEYSAAVQKLLEEIYDEIETTEETEGI